MPGSDSFSLKTKLVAGFGTVVAMVLVLGLVGWTGLKRVYSAGDDVATHKLPAVRALLSMAKNEGIVLICERGLMIPGMSAPELRQAQYKGIETAHKAIDDAVTLYKTIPRDEKSEAAWKKVESELSVWRQESGKLVSIAREKDAALSSGVSKDDPKIAEIEERTFAQSLTSRKAFKGLEGATDELIELNIKAAKNASDSARKIYSGISTFIGIAILLIAIFSIIITGALTTLVTRTLGAEPSYLAHIVKEVASGNLAVRIETRPGDRSSILHVIAEMVASLKELISRIKQTSETIASSSGEIHSTAIQIATGAEQIAAQATLVATSSEEMSSTSRDIANNCTIASEGGNKAAQLVNVGSEKVMETGAGMCRISEKVQTAADVVTQLGARSEQIGQIVGTIEDIADQTNLLALNAAIEAARAGEMGRGFAVVADEVRALAERTTKATKEIAETIKTIQNETRLAVNTMTEGVSEVEVGTNEVMSSGDAFSEIMEQVSLVSDQLAQIATAIEEQSAVTGSITTNIHEISNVILDSAKQSQDSAEAAQGLAALAEDLKRLADRFRVE